MHFSPDGCGMHHAERRAKFIHGRDPTQSSQQNSGVTKKKEAARIEFEKSLFQTPSWKMNFESEFCSSSSFPTEAMVWINEIDSARNMNEL